MGARELVFTAELRVRYRPGEDPDSLQRTTAAEGRRAARELYQELARTMDGESVRRSWNSPTGRSPLGRNVDGTGSPQPVPRQDRLRNVPPSRQAAAARSRGGVSSASGERQRAREPRSQHAPGRGGPDAFHGVCAPRQTVWLMLRSD